MSPAENPDHKLFGEESKLMFGQVREDSSVDMFLLDQLSDPKRAVVVASGGCTALSLLTTGEVQIDALDISRAQIAIVELKMAAFKQLGFEGGRKLCTSDARDGYNKVRPFLPEDTQLVLDKLRGNMDRGLNTAGWVDRSMRNLTKVFYALVHSESKTNKFLSLSNVDEQKKFYDKEWCSLMWRAITRIAFDRNFLALLHGKAALNLVPPNFSVIMRNRLEHALTASPNSVNPYLWQSFFSKYPGLEEGYPPYLQLKLAAKLIDNLENLRLSCTDMLPWLRGQEPASIDYFGLSNILELLPAKYSRALARQLVRCGRPGAIVCVRSIFPRSSKELTFANTDGMVFDNKLTDHAGERDRSLFCNFYEVYQIE